MFETTTQFLLLFLWLKFQDLLAIYFHSDPSQTYTYKPLPGSPFRPVNKCSFRKDHYFIVGIYIYNQQFQGTIILMVFDLQDILIYHMDYHGRW